MLLVGEPNTPSNTLSSRLRDETADVHEAAERSAFVTQLLDGALPIDAYVQLLAQYLPIYRALELAAESVGGDSVAGGFVFHELDRRHAIESDLITLGGADWSERVHVTEAALAYRDRVAEVGADWPGGWVAHQYVRYLGDLSGGQFIRHRLRRVFELEVDAGLSFYVFDQIDNGVQFKKQYRELLDSAGWDATERDRIVAEARRAFQLNIDLFAALAPISPVR